MDAVSPGMTLPQLPWPETAYRFDLPQAIPVPSDLAREVYRRVWRTSLHEPGFAVIRFGSRPGSHELRRFMLALVEAMPLDFVPERLGRFDQQVSSRLHRDGGPQASLLLLGYEPSQITSRLFIADAYRAAIEKNLEIEEYLAQFNPMLPAGETALQPFVTEVAVPKRDPFVVAINNSLLPNVAGAENPPGVLHKAVVLNPSPHASRIINSIGLVPAGYLGTGIKDPDAICHFLDRDELD